MFGNQCNVLCVECNGNGMGDVGESERDYGRGREDGQVFCVAVCVLCVFCALVVQRWH